jgi:hypothetical protein
VYTRYGTLVNVSPRIQTRGDMVAAVCGASLARQPPRSVNSYSAVRCHQRDTNHCEGGYHELQSVSRRPVVQPSQKRLGFSRDVPHPVAAPTLMKATRAPGRW